MEAVGSVQDTFGMAPTELGRKLLETGNLPDIIAVLTAIMVGLDDDDQLRVAAAHLSMGVDIMKEVAVREQPRRLS